MTQNRRHEKIPKSLKELMDAMKYKSVLDDNIIKQQKDQVMQAKANARRYANSLFPSRLDKSEARTKDMLIENLISNAPDSGKKYTSLLLNDNGYPEIEALSDYHKTLTGRIINKNHRIELARYIHTVKYHLEEIERPKRVKTDFYKHSMAFDDNHSKTDNGYWQSDVELFARAFACYVTDKVKEMHGQSDYLSGHSEAAVSITSDKDGHTTTIRAFPFGEERKQINKKFDAFFCELKEMEILHRAELSPDFFQKRAAKKEKATLHSLILSAKAEKDGQQTKNASLKMRERKDGQLEFEL